MEKKENLIKNVLAGLIGKKVSSEMELSREEVVRLLKTTPEALDAFERAYKREVLNNPDESRMFGVSAKQMHEKNEDYVENQPDLNSLMCKIVKELLAQTKVWEYKKIGREPFELNASFEDKSGTSVTTETLNAIPRENRPQLAGDIILRTGVDEIPTSQQLLYWYSKAINEDLSEDERMMAYSMFREGLDLLDLDEISYRIIGENQVSMGYWLPKIAPVVDYDGFFKIPNTKIMKVPLPVLQLTFAEYSTLTRATLDIVNELCMRAFRLRTDADYFIKTGVFSSKFDFRNARVHDPKEIREMGEYFLFVHNMSRNLGFMSYGVATKNEWVVREFIPDKEDNLTIYHGLPLHTEYRVFVDFDTKEVLGIHPYWDPDVMKKHFSEKSRPGDPDAYHDYCTYSVNEDKLMQRYEKNKDIVCEHARNIVFLDNELTGQWSVDIMQNGDDFWLIDMAPAFLSAFHECIPAGKLKITEQDWLPEIPEV